MEVLKHYGLISLKFILGLIIGSLIISVMYYFFLSSKAVNIFSLIYLGSLFLIFSYIEGKKTSAKGYKAGIKIGLLFIFLMFLVNVIFYRSFTFIKVIYYFILFFIAILGSMIGINRKKN